jgi:hypothetical protein
MSKSQRNPLVGKRVNVYIPGRQRETAVQIENLSAFFQIALDNAADIMAWAILRDVKPKTYTPTHKLENVIDDFNDKYPLDPLTQKRQGKWQIHSPKLPDVLL